GSYHATGFGPMRTPRYVAEQARLFRENNVQGIYLCGGFESMGLEGPVFYSYGKLLHNPDLDEKELAQDFYRHAYGQAATPMANFFTTLHERLELYCAINRPNYPVKNAPAIADKPEAIYSALYPAGVLQKLSQDLEAAKQLDNNPAVQARLRLVEREFDYVKTLANVFHAHRDYQAKPDWESFGKVQQAVETRTGVLSAWYDEKDNKKS